MYIEKTLCGYDSSGQQIARRALFLMLVQPKTESTLVDNKLQYKVDTGEICSSITGDPEFPIRAIVRKVALQQFGHFMMGNARVKGKVLTISGSYGSDGLPMSVSMQVYNEAIPLPKYLIEAWNKGGGWNSCGSEASEMRKWAIDNLDKLYRVKGGK